MTTQVPRIVVVVACLFVCLSLVGIAQGKTSPEAYSGVATGTGGRVGVKSIQFDFRNTQFTIDEEVQNFGQLVKEKGTDALRRALVKGDKGRINAVGSTRNQIAVARTRQHGTDTTITVVTALIMPFIELYNNGRTTDYTFGFLQATLNDKGEEPDRSWQRRRFASIRKKRDTKSRATATSASKPSISAPGNDRWPRLFLPDNPLAIPKAAI